MKTKFLYISILALFLANFSNAQDVPVSEKEALQALYDSTNGNNWTNTIQNNEIWDFNTPVYTWINWAGLGWYGIRRVNGHVDIIRLKGNNLNGSLPSELVQLPELIELTVTGNLSGNIPVEYSQLQKLEELTLSSSNFSGEIPVWLSQLQNLKKLSLGGGLSGNIPTELTQLPLLESLGLTGNNFVNNSIPSFIGNISTLKYLRLVNDHEGTIPNEFTLLSNLDKLYLGWNNLSGTIPDLTNLPLWSFDIRKNKFRFIDFETEFATYKSNIEHFYYSPQQNIDDEENITLPLGANHDLVMFTTGTHSNNNTYQWYKGVYPNGIKITGAINRIHSLVNVSGINAGNYYCLANNVNVTGLTLQRNKINIKVGDNSCTETPVGSIYTAAGKICFGDNKQYNFSGNLTNATYTWNFYASDNETILHTTNEVSPNFTYTNVAEFQDYIIELIVTTEGNCSYGYTHVITIEDCTPPCVAGNPNSDVVKGLFLKLLNHLRERQLNYQTIPDGYNPQELIDLAPYIADTNPKIYNFLGSNFLVPAMQFGFSDDHEDDVYINLWPRTVDYKVGDVDLSNYISSNYATKVLYNYENDGTIPSSRDHFVKHINFCPTEILPQSCTVTNQNTSVVKGFYLNLLNHLKQKQNEGVSIPEGYNPPEMQALAPYISESSEAKVYSFTALNGSMSFSFASSAPIFQHGVDVEISNWDDAFDFGLGDVNLANYASSNLYTNGAVYYANSGLEISNHKVRHINFCPDEIIVPSDNSFCLSEMEDYPTVGNLTPSGTNIEWYTSETGGVPLSNDEELVEETEDPTGAIYWWDNTLDSNPVRTQENVIVYGMTLAQEENEYQTFSQNLNPTIADLTPANAIWYSNDLYVSPLSSSTALVSGATYYGEVPGETCNILIDVFIGTKPPTGDVTQYLCPKQTIQDIVIELQGEASTAVWYDSEGGSVLPVSTELSNNVIYYVAQIDEYGVESEELLAVTVFLNTVNQPVVPFPIQIFDIDQTPPPTIADLIAYGYDIKWYPQVVGGNVYGESEALDHGSTYWAEQNVGPCPSTRVPVVVQIIDIPEPPLLGCEKFKPQPGDRYVINAWVREQGVIATNPQVRPFNDSPEEVLFLELLKHLLFVTQHEDHDIHDITEGGYIATSPTENLDFDPLIPFVKYIGQEIKLKVYSYERILDDYGRSIGFKFKLSDHADALIFEWKSPTIVLYPGTIDEQTVRYPINDNPDLEIQFTNAEIQGNDIIITSDFNATGTPPLIIPNYTYTSTSGLEESITDHDYEEIPNFQLIDYMDTLVDIKYKDEDQNDLPIPAGEAIPVFKPKGEIIDGWQRIYGEFKIPGNAAQMTINLKNEAIDGKFAYFDDIRMHPYDSNMKTFVYHPETQQLMSELDENNYATFYEYDAEGGLIRVKKETEKGVYTIQETRSSTTKQTN